MNIDVQGGLEAEMKGPAVKPDTILPGSGRIEYANTAERLAHYGHLVMFGHLGWCTSSPDQHDAHFGRTGSVAATFAPRYIGRS